MDNTLPLTSRLTSDEPLFLTNEANTSIQLLTGRALQTGGFALAFRTNENTIPALALNGETNPTAGLTLILNRLNQATRPINPIQLDTFPGAYVDLEQDPTDLIFNASQGIKLRMALFIKPETAMPTFILMGAAQSEWNQYSAIFDYMLDTLVLFDLDTGRLAGTRLLDASASNGYRDAIVGQLDVGKVDFWVFTAVEGRYATLTLTPGNEQSDLTLTLLAPSGRTVAQQDSGYGGDSELLADLLLPETGAYIIQVSEFFNEPDTYGLTISLSDEPIYGGGGTLEINQQIQATLRPTAEDTWQFNGQEGQTISIILTPLDEFDAVFTLYAPDGSTIATYDEGYSGDAEVWVGYILPTSGQYSLTVNSFGDNGGDYQLAIDEENDFVANYFEAGQLAYDTTQRQTLQTDEVHAWYIEGRAGDEIFLAATPIDKHIDLDVWLVDPDGRRLVMQDENIAGEQERITHILPRDGLYIVVIQDFFLEQGKYEITLSASGENYLIEGGLVGYGETRSAILQRGRGTIWTFSGETGDIINLRLSPQNAQSDLVVSLRDAEGNPAIQIDDTLAGNDEALINFQLTSTGMWSIIVQEYFDAGGNYTLTLTNR